MDKRERKTRLKNIIKMVNEGIVSVEEGAKVVIGTAQDKINDLGDYLEVHCIEPPCFDTDEMIKEILIDYFDNDTEVTEIKNEIQSLKEDILEHTEEMREGSNKDEWEDFYSSLESVDEVLDVHEQNIEDVDSFIENMGQLKNNLEDLI